MNTKKTIFITGAGSGIGAAAARYFSGQGWFVGLYDLNQKSVEIVAKELGEDCCHGFIDVVDRTVVNKAFEHFSSTTAGRLDVMLNNAGLFQDKPFNEADPDYLDLMMRVNIDGVVNCSRAAHPLLKATADSHLVNLSSASALYGVPNSAVYSASKFFVRGLSEALRIEWEKDNITVNMVMPSYVATPMCDGVELSHDSSEILTVDEVVVAIWEAATGKGMYWILPRSARIGNFFLRKLPLNLVPRFTSRKFNTNRIEK
jgi:NADP-dependent 3-hydroxy acid dehydrogenase YdfG